MLTWIKENAWLSGAVVFCASAVATGAIAWHQLSGLIAAQPEVQRHIYDDSRHLDTEEKKQMKAEIEDLKRRLRALEVQRWRQHIDRQKGRRNGGN